MSTYWQSLGCIIVLRIWNRPRILMELGVRGRPLLPQTSWGRAEAKKVKAPSCASLRGLILTLGRELVMGTTGLYSLTYLYTGYWYETLQMRTSARCSYSKHSISITVTVACNNITRCIITLRHCDQTLAYSRLMNILCTHLDRIRWKTIGMNFFFLSPRTAERTWPVT